MGISWEYGSQHFAGRFFMPKFAPPNDTEHVCRWLFISTRKYSKTREKASVSQTRRVKEISKISKITSAAREKEKASPVGAQ